VKIDITMIKAETGAQLEFNFTKSISPLDYQDENLVFTEPLVITGNVINISDAISLQGSVKTVIQFHCHRCLEKFETNYSAEFEEEFPLKPKSDENEPVDELGDNIIDIYDIVISSILLHLPMKRLCDEYCKGLCEQCGVNLNKEECDCITDKIDPRLAVLEKLLQSQNDNT